MNAKRKTETEKTILSNLEYFYSHYSDHPQEILSSLEGKSDPESIRRQLIILLSMKDYKKAAKLIIKKRPHEAWYDLAIVALTNNGHEDKIVELLHWASRRETKIWHRAIHIYATNHFRRIWRNRERKEDIHIGSLDETERKELSQLINVIQPVLRYIEGLGKTTNKSQEEMLSIALKSYALLGDKQRISQFSDYSHDTLTLGSLAMCGLIDLPNDLLEDLESNYPDSYEAQRLAVLIRAQFETYKEEDFDEDIKRLAKYSSSKQRNVEIFQILSDIAHKHGEPFIETLEHKVAILLRDNERLIKMFKCERLLKNKQLSESDKILKETKDANDPVWLQLYSSYLYLVGKTKEALDYSNKARLLLPNPELLHSTAKLAFETGEYGLSVELLEKELENKPDDVSLLNNIAAAYFRKGDFKSAANYYEKLRKFQTEDLLYHLNCATCYAQIGDSNKAIEIYDEVCERNDAPLDAYLSRAYLIRIDNPVRAFDSIAPLKDKYWENTQYLQVILDLSYRAGKEEYGHQAMLKLLELQRQGKAPQEVLQAKTIKDIEVYINEWNKKIEYVNKNILIGKLPWLMSDHWQNHTAYMGWYIRTQPLSWRVEEPLNCASFSIYSTNSFSPVKLPDGTTKLDYFECPQKNVEIVIDLSAIITLHRLGLLEICLKYFSRIYILQKYSVVLLQDSDNLGIHQHTRKTSAEAIRKAIDSRQIAVLDYIGRTGDRPFPFIHEHTLPEKEEEHYYRLIDIIQVAYDTGRLNEEQYEALKNIAHKPSGNNPDYPGLKCGQSIYVDIHTLYSICQINISSLESILNTFKVYISKADQLRNYSETIQIEIQEQLKSWNDQLLEIIRERDEFIKEPHHPEPEIQDDDVYFASCWKAKEKSLPLLVDDRVLQVVAINENNDIEYSSFGTDRLLLKLHEAKLIDIEALSDAFLTLMEWRYRFLVPTKDILIALAKRYKNHPPGEDLQNVALYLHDCMRDPGLFAGLENTTAKESMAIKLYTTWIRLIPDFLVGIWADTGFSDEAAKAITEWSLQEFMPSIPKNIVHKTLEMSEILPKVIFGYFYAFMFKIDDASRANRALQTIAKSLHMSEPEYFKAVSDMVEKYGNR